MSWLVLFNAAAATSRQTLIQLRFMCLQWLSDHC